MAQLDIPEKYRLGVSAIRLLDERDVRAIRDALDFGAEHQESSNLEAVARKDDIVVSAVTSASSIKPDDFKSVVEAITALYGVRASREESIEEFAEEVSDALESIPEENLRLPSAERAKFKEKLISLLSADAFTVISKVPNLAVEYERTFCHARIVTDLRPVFGSDVDDGPKAMMIRHNLTLAYHQGSKETLDFYVTLDADDLRTLKQLIARAEAKAKSLRSFVKKGTPVLE